MHQQVYVTIVLEFTVYSIVPGREPRVRIQQRLNGAVFKADDCILRRRHICKPQSIDGIQTILTQVVLDRIPINGILHTGKLHISISIVWVAVGVNIGFRFLHLIVQVDIILSLFLGIFHSLPSTTAATLDAKHNQIRSVHHDPVSGLVGIFVVAPR